MAIELIQQGPGDEAHPTPILFIHGAWHGAWCWEEHFMPFLAERGYNTYALSLRGHAGSSGDCAWAGLTDYLADVREAVEQINPHPVLIGHSMGGYITQQYIAQYAPEVPAAALLASVPLNGILPSALRFIAAHPQASWNTIRRLNTGEMVREAALARRLFFSPTLPEADLQRYHAQMQAESGRMLFEMALRPPVARRYDFPMLVFGAVNDTCFTRHEVRQTARAYGTEAEFFNMAHDMMLDTGWEAVAERLAGWLDEGVA